MASLNNKPGESAEAPDPGVQGRQNVASWSGIRFCRMFPGMAGRRRQRYRHVLERAVSGGTRSDISARDRTCTRSLSTANRRDCRRIAGRKNRRQRPSGDAKYCARRRACGTRSGAGENRAGPRFAAGVAACTRAGATANRQRRTRSRSRRQSRRQRRGARGQCHTRQWICADGDTRSGATEDPIVTAGVGAIRPHRNPRLVWSGFDQVARR